MCIRDRDDNVGVEAAHKVEQAVESGGRLVQSAHRAHQLQPYRAAIRAEKKLERANLDAVSYTHLDVYKRQIWLYFALNGRGITR